MNNEFFSAGVPITEPFDMHFFCTNSVPGQKRLSTGDVYGGYRSFCTKINLRALTQRAFSDLVSELDMYGFIHARILSKGRFGRTKEITVNLPHDIIAKLKQVVLMEFDLNPIQRPLN